MRRLTMKLGLPFVVSVLTACGGGTETVGTMTLSQVPAGALNLDTQPLNTKVPNIKASDSALAVKKSAAWIHLDRASGDTSKSSPLHLGLRKVTASSAATTPDNDQADGLLINVDALNSGWEKAGKAALTSGKVLVLESTDTTNGIEKIRQASLKLVGISVEAMAVMIYQANADDSNAVSLMPFQANELEDLSKLMNMVGKRGSAVPVSLSASFSKPN